MGLFSRSSSIASDSQLMERGEVKEAMFWKPLKEKRVKCGLCRQGCMIPPEKYGICGIRKNIDGKLMTLLYGKVSSSHPDPVEKKPLFHFHPGSRVLSFGGLGCNMKCSHCQNADISQGQLTSGLYLDISPVEIVSMSKRLRCKGVAWTYNEPTIWFEFNYRCSKVAKKEGLYTVYVTNGYMEEDPLREIAPYLDAANIDVKAFDNAFYKRVCKSKLDSVKECVELHKELGIHIELTYLVIPGHNDTKEEIKDYCEWVVSKLGPDVPLHFTRFHPDHKMRDIPATPLKTLDMAWDTAKAAGSYHVYLGNVFSGHHEDSICHKCNKIVIKRVGYNIQPVALKGSKCGHCGQKLNFIV